MKRTSRLRWSAAAIFATGTALAGAVSVQAAKPATRPAADGQKETATRFSLNGDWMFALARTPADAARLSSFSTPGFDTSAFQRMPVPSNWVMQGVEAPTYGKFKEQASEGFYLRRFVLPTGFDGKRMVLRFGGVWSSAEVWLNGTLLGRNDSGFTEFAYDATPSLKAGENVLAVRVRQTHPDYLLDTNDDWSLPGIYRDVWIDAMPAERWIDRVEVRTTFDDHYRDADLSVRLMVQDKTPTKEDGNLDIKGPPYDVRLTLLGADGKEVAGRTLTQIGHPRTARDHGITLRVPTPQHWTAETPHLYTLKVDLIEKGVVSQSRTVRVGFRDISTAGGVLRINGQTVKLRGVNRHDEDPDLGRATTSVQWRRDLELMKAANINYIRLAHYPPAQGFLDLCDEMGMYVSDEVPMGYGGDGLADPEKAAGVMLRSYATVERDINHPSIIIWSIGNEDPLTALHLASIRTVKGLDPTRPVLMPWRFESALPPEIDILAPHYLKAKDNDAVGAAATRPVVTTEFTHAFGTEGFGGLEERWQALIRHPSGAGGAIWMWADQGIRVSRRTPEGGTASKLEVPAEAFDGIVDSDRKPTRDYWETKAVYAPIRLPVEQVAFTPGQSRIKLPVRNDFDFTDLGSIGVEWTIMENLRKLAEGKTSLAAAPHETALLELPAETLNRPKPAATYYASLTFRDASGAEITTRSVELLPPAGERGINAAPVAPTIDRSAGLTIRSGTQTFRFDPATGQLASVHVGDRLVLEDMKPALWRPYTSTETWVTSWGDMKNAPDLNRATPKLRSWKVTEQDDAVLIEATVDYVLDADNRFDVRYLYRIDAPGKLTLHYSVATAVRAKWIPFVGMSFRRAPDIQRVAWTGLGPFDSFPNENMAGRFGVWSAPLADPIEQTKAARSANLLDATGDRIHIENAGYIDFGGPEAERVRVLSSVRGRTSKSRQPDDPDHILTTNGAEPFAGEFTLSF